MAEARSENSVDKKDLELLYQKVCQLHGTEEWSDWLSQIDSGRESYFKEWPPARIGMREYSVSNVPALRKELEQLWGETRLKELIPIVLAAAFKTRERVKVETQYQEELPTYIYNF